jgi:hypothetical protein
VDVRFFKAEDFFALDPQPAQAHLREIVTVDLLRAMEGPTAWTGFVDGKPLWCFGYLPVYATRAAVWAFIGRHAGPHFTRIHREAATRLDALPFRRLEMQVDCDFEEGHRWARLLGFELEVERLRCFGFDGRDNALYAKVK